MTVNTTVKGILAKLLATENLHVEHRKITTAYFDVQNRTLALPIWKDVTGNVYDLLVGHEVGHALYTPDEDFGNAPKDYVNVIEDARIERKMKLTYPGLRKSFFLGYQELQDRDFFSVKYRNISEYNLLDRINLYYKIGTSAKFIVPFSEEELVWVERVGKTVTFKDVVTLSEDLYAFCKDRQETLSEKEIESPNDSESSGEYSPSGSQTNQSSSETEDGDVNDEDVNSEEFEYDPSQDFIESPGGGSGCVEFSETQQEMIKAQESLVDESAREWVYLTIPKIDLDNHLVPWRVINKDMKEQFEVASNLDLKEFLFSSPNVAMSFYKFEQYKKNAQKSVNYLVKQFEMRKAADQYSRTGISKTGTLNTNKIHNYRITEDIFKKLTVTPDAKNHGLIFQVDWSGSMQTVLMDTLKQLYNLLWFCKKVSIPFEVYAFQSGETRPNRSFYETTTIDDMNSIVVSSDIRFLQLFSSEMNNRMLDSQMKLIWAQCFGMVGNGYGHGYCSRYTLGGTPLAEAVIATPQLVDNFVARENVQKVNVVFLTDGEANPMRYITSPSLSSGKFVPTATMLCHNTNKVHILTHPVTRYQKKILPYHDVTTQEIVSFYREMTDYNWIGFSLCTKSDMTLTVSQTTAHNKSFSPKLLAKCNNTWTKERFAEVSLGKGFNVLYMLPNKYLGQVTEDLTVGKKGEVATKSELQRAFKKHMGSKMTNKTLLNKFVEQIA